MRPFQSVGGLKPRLTKWNLSYTKKFTTDMGKLIPIMCDECVPGDVWKIGNQCVIRFQPLLAPVLHEVSVYTHYFFVPYRLLWEDWEAFITGGDDGSFSGTLPSLKDIQTSSGIAAADYYGLGSLADYLYNIVPPYTVTGWTTEGTKNFGDDSVCAFPIQAYNLVWNEYYRDENVDAETDLDNPYVLRRRWKKDYFTSALPWRQRGIAPALPISTTIQNIWTNQSWANGDGHGSDLMFGTSSGNPFDVLIPSYASTFDGNMNSKMAAGLSGVTGTSTSFDVNDLRLAFQLQKWLERSARSGARYTESLRAHFGVSPADDRLQRPEYIGGTKQGVVFSEVLQTSATGQTGAETPQGNLAGHGLVADSGFAGKYRVKEYGLIMGIMSVVPKSTYSYGINRQWLRETRYDYYWPEFAHLGEQAVQFREIWENFSSSSDSKDIFGYQGRYDEMRYKPSTVHSGMRKTFDYWHLSREFSSCPHLNSDFLECNPSKRIFAVQDEDTLIVNFANVLTALRPIPYIAEPGLIDHN